MGTKRVSLDMDEEFHKRLKLAAVQEETTIRNLCLEAIRTALEEQDEALSDREQQRLEGLLTSSMELQKRIKERRGSGFKDDSAEIIRNARDRR